MCVENYELNPCPFCGGKGETVLVYPADDSIVGETVAAAFAIRCAKCNALGKRTKQIQLPMGITRKHVDLESKKLSFVLLKQAVIYWNSGLMSDLD
jgi:hypothetical protein